MSSRRFHQGKKQTPTSEAMDTAEFIESLESTDVDWRDSKTAGQCLSHLCLSDHLSDITFTFSSHNNVKLPAHRFVLSMRSSVFEAMFHGPLAEVGNTVLIEDIDPDTMKVLLRFVYSDNPKLDENNVLACLYAAKKYALPGLVNHCSSFLDNNIDSSNVCALHDQAVFYDLKPLKTRYFEYILENAAEVLASDDFLKVTHATLLNLLIHEELAEEEVNVFNAAIKWSYAYCKAKNVTPDAQHMRESLGDALFAIRFPIIPAADFTKVVIPVGILTDEEKLMVYGYITTEGSTLLEKFPVRTRSRKKTTIDIPVDLQSSGSKAGYLLRIQNQPSEEQPEGTRNPRIKSFTGTFVKDIVKISSSKFNKISQFVPEGNKITLTNPLEIPYGMFDVWFNALSFDLDANSPKSYFTKISLQIHDRQLDIQSIPAGLETISFV